MQAEISRDLGIKYLNYIGMPWRKTTPADKRPPIFNNLCNNNRRYVYSWDGNELLVSPKRDGFDLIHEACHWLVAARPELPEFGLGDTPYFDVIEYRDIPAVGWSEAQDEEYSSSVLMVIVYKVLGEDWRACADVLNVSTSSWDDDSYTSTDCEFLGAMLLDDNRKEIKRLRSRGVLRAMRMTKIL